MIPFEDMKDIIDAESARLLAIGKNRDAGKMKKKWNRMVNKKYGWFEDYAGQGWKFRGLTLYSIFSLYKKLPSLT